MDGILPTQTSEPSSRSRLSASYREMVRQQVSAHLSAGKPVCELKIERNKPADLNDFAFVGATPEQKSHENYYRCSFCEVDKKFGADGRIVLSNDGNLRLIGDRCWNRHLSSNRYSEEVEDQRNFQLRQHFLAVKTKLGPLLHNLIDKQEEAIEDFSNALQFIDRLGAWFDTADAGLVRLLKEAYRQGGLSVERSVRNPVTGRAEMQRVPTHRLNFSALVGAPTASASDVLRARKYLYQAREAFVEVMKLHDASESVATLIKTIRDRLTKANDANRSAGNAVHAALQFFSGRTRSGLVEWSRDTDCELQVYGELSLTNAGLKFLDVNGQAFEITPPFNLKLVTVPDLDPLVRLFQ